MASVKSLVWGSCALNVRDMPLAVVRPGTENYGGVQFETVMRSEWLWKVFMC